MPNAYHMSLTTTETLTDNITARLREAVDRDPSAVRKGALEYFLKSGLPGSKHEEYKHTPITRELQKNFSFIAAPVSPLPVEISEFGIPALEAYVLVFIDGIFSKTQSNLPSSGLRVMELSAAIVNDAVAQEHFARYNPGQSDPLSAWNAAGWNHGVFVHVPANTAVARPVIMHYVNTGASAETVSILRNLVVVGRGSELTIIEKFDSAAGVTNHFSNHVTEVVVDENAGFNLFTIQNDSGNRYQFSHTEIYQRNASRVNTYTFTLNGKFVRNNLHLVLDGEGIESHMYGLYLLEGTTLADNHTVVDHRKPNSFSNELYKGIMAGSSKGVFNGKIYVRPHAQKTNAFQANRNILLTDKAAVNTKPQLEIWADDVKCSHGCTSGQLDEEAVFYLRSRGIHQETARAMMLYAFAGEVLDQVKSPVLHKYLDGIISERLHKNF